MSKTPYRAVTAIALPTTGRAVASLADLVRVTTLQTLQDRFCDLGKVTVCTATVTGELITKPSWGSPFSELIGRSPRGSKSFDEAIRACSRDWNTQVPSLCHKGMTLYATPISYEGTCLAVLIVGTRAPKPSPEAVRAAARTFGLDPQRLLRAADSIDPYNGGEPEAINRFADVLAETIAAMYGRNLRIARQLADLQVVHGFSQLLASTRDLQEILDTTVERIARVLAVKACSIRLLDEDSGELVLKAVHNLSEEYLRKGPVMLRDNTIDAKAFAGETVYIEDAPSDPRIRYPEDARREGIVSGLCVPMTYRGRTIGVVRVYTAVKYVFDPSEESLLRSIGSQAAAAITNSRLLEERLATEGFQRQVNAAAQIQRRMIPASLPEHGGLEFGCVYEPTLKVGGDFYDFIDLPGDRLGVCIADVVGKGLPAALLMASARSALRAFAGGTHEVDAVLSAVNRHMFRDTLDSEFVTLFYGVFSAGGKRFSYCNAGHTAPLLLRGDEFEELTVGGLVIGVSSEAQYERETISIRPDDVLVLITDGVTEAMDFSDRVYGADRLRTSIERHRSAHAPLLANQLLWDVRRFVGLAEQSDDISVVVVKAR